MDNYLIIKKMKVSEASMDTSPVTRGFPGIPALMGFVHALQRKLQTNHPGTGFVAAGISCHSFDPGMHNTGEGVKISMSRNPPHEKRHLEKGVPFIEEGKADMLVSVIICVERGEFEAQGLIDDTTNLLPSMRFSGGTIWGAEQIRIVSCSKDDEKGQKMVLRQLMPGFVLLDRKDLVEKSMEQGLDALDSLLDHLEVSRMEPEEVHQKAEWAKKSGEPGWLVPISVGYHALSASGRVANQRDPDIEHCFAENVITLGEFAMPTRLDRVEQLLWSSKTDENQGLYLYAQKFQNKGD